MSIVANTHCINLLLNIPLKSANCYFALFKVISLPTRISSDKFVQYSIDYLYFGLQNSQRPYLMLTETDYSHCKQGSITICPANTPVYNAQWRVCLVFFSRVQILTVSANEKCFFSTKLLLFNIMEKYGLFTFQRDTRFHCDALAPMTRYTAQ